MVESPAFNELGLPEGAGKRYSLEELNALLPSPEDQTFNYLGFPEGAGKAYDLESLDKAFPSREAQDTEKEGREGMIFIKTQVKKAIPVEEKLWLIPEVTSTTLLAGEWDIVAIVKAQYLKGIGQTVIGRIQKIEGVAETTTAIILKKT